MLRLINRISDASLVRKAQAGRREAFEALVRRYLPLVHGVALAHTGNVADADDVAQETFLKAMTQLGGLREPSRFGMWIGTIARRCAMDVHRARRRFVAGETSEESVVPDPARDEMFALMRSKLDSLDGDHREILLLHYYAGYSVREAADHLNITNEAAKKRLQRARTALGEEVMKALAPDAMAWDRARSLVLAAVAKAPLVAGSGESTAAAGVAASAAVGIPFVAKLAAVGAVVTAAAVAVVLMTEDRAPEEQVAVADVAVAAPENENDERGGNDGENDIEEAVAATEVDAATSADADPWAGFPVHGQVFGRVVNENGVPVPNARITAATNIGGDDRRWEAVTDGAGAFTLEDVRAQYLFVMAEAEGLFAADTFTMKDEEPEEMELVARPSAALEGVVVDTEGNPVEGAQAYLFAFLRPGDEENFGNESYIDQRWSDIRDVRSGPHGHIRIDPLWPGKWSVSMMKEGRGSASVQYASTDGPPFKAVMPVASSVSGRVIDAASGKGISGLELRLSSGHTTSGEDGRFVFADISPGSLVFELPEDTTWAFAQSPRLVVSEGRTVSDYSLALRVGGRLTGRVVDSASGEGLADVGLNIQQEGVVFRNARTDARGEFTVAGLPPGPYKVVGLNKEAYATPAGYREQAEVIDVAFGQTARLNDIALESSVVLRGRVMPVGGEALAECTVRVVVDGKTKGESYWVSPEGDFTVPLSASEVRTATLFAESATARSAMAGPFTPGSEASQSIELSLGHARPTIEGRVVDLNGTPVTGATVYANNESNPRKGRNAKSSDADGTFVLGLDEPGRYRISATSRDVTMPPGEGVPGVEAQLVDVSSSSGVRGIEVIVQGYVGESIEGIVVDGEGIPLAGVSVQIESYGQWQTVATSEADGRFTTSKQFPGSKTSLCVEDSVHGSALVSDVAAGARGIELRLSRPGVVVGRVASHRGEALPEFYVALLDAAPPGMLLGVQGGQTPFVRDPEGTFRLNSGARGERILVAVAPDYAPIAKPVTVNPESETDVGTIRLEGESRIAGRVVDSEGRPIAGAKAAVLTERDYVRRQTHNTVSCNGDGRFEIGMLAPGTYAVGAFSPECAPVTEIVSVGRGATAEVTITLLPAATVRVRTLNRGEIVQTHVSIVRLTDDGEWPAMFGGSMWGSTYDEALGRHLFPDLLPGTYGVMAHSSSGMRTMRKAVTVNAGDVVDVDMDPDAGTARLEGTLVRADGPLVERSAINARIYTDNGEVIVGGVTDESGHFVLDGLPAGTATLCEGQSFFEVSRAGMAAVSCTLAEGRTTTVQLGPAEK